MKKVFKITGIILAICLVILIAIPLVLESKIDNIVKAYVEENINAKVEFDDISLSLISSFPKANVTIENLKITNNAPFEDEILTTTKSIELDMAIKELFKNKDDEPIIVDAIYIDESLVTVKLNQVGIANYDIIKASESNSNENSQSSGFKFSIDDYNINNSAITYIDEESNTTLYVSKLNHSGKGTFSDTMSELETTSEANISFNIDNTDYLKNNHIILDALIDLNLETSTYTFKDNKGFINQLPLEFQGFIQQKEEGNYIDLSFTNPESSFKDFLAVIPEVYSKNLDGVETTGDFKVNGLIKGLISDETIPTLDINTVSNNASFKYPNLPKRVENISLNASIRNDTKKPEDTYIALEKLNFKIDQDVFKSSATISNLTENILVNANIDGTLNLSNISKAYPIELDKNLSGILKGKLNTSFDVNALETNAYERIKNSGNVSITDFIFSSEDIVNPIHISNANMTFKPGQVSLNGFNAKTGKSDLAATGTITNLLGFLLSNKNLQGNFKVNSNTFVVSDFMVEDETASKDNKTTSDSQSLKIPDFLDCTIIADAKTVVYDNLNLKNVKGTLDIKDQQATLKNMSSNLFDGTLDIAGNISTKEKTPTFDLNLDVDAFDVSKSFKDLELLQNLAPIAKILQGKLNTVIQLNGNLNEEFTPDLMTISGNALAEIFTSSINPLQGDLLDKLGNALNFIDFDKLNLNDLKTKLDFKDGLVSVKPFNFKYEDIEIQLSGTHSFDKAIDYNMVFNVPAKYLGSEINQLIGRINDNQVNEITIPVTATISGNYKSPKVETDITSGITKLTNQLIEIEKKKLLNQGIDKLDDALYGLLGGTTQETDSTQIDSSNTQTNNPLKEGIKDVLGGLLGNKKMKDSTKN